MAYSIYIKLQATIYRCLPDGGIEIVQVLEDANTNEEFYVCKWSIDLLTGAPLLLLAGKNALLQVYDLSTGKLATSFEGHGNCINDVAVHPTLPHLVVTASKDHCLRLWNLRSRVCILVFEGDGGHRSEVLCADWQLSNIAGNECTLVSGGMDNRIKIWNLSSYASFIKESDSWDISCGTAFAARHVTVPLHTVEGVHWNYVDCIKWFGCALLSKSVSDSIVCWMIDEEAARRMKERRREEGDPPPGQTEAPVHFVGALQLEDAQNVWWMRFSLDFRGKLLAQGTSLGGVLLFSLDPFQEQPIAKLKPSRVPLMAAGKEVGKGKGGSPKLLVRQTAVNFDGTIVLCCHENGSLTRYDLL